MYLNFCVPDKEELNMSSTSPMPKKTYEKHAWIMLFALGTLYLLAAFTHVTGLSLEDLAQELQAASPTIAHFVRFTDREAGIDLAGFAILAMVIAAGSYRKGDRWAWYVLWILPLHMLALTATSLVAGQTFGLALSVPFVIIALLGLLLPYRMFFPKKQQLDKKPHGQPIV